MLKPKLSDLAANQRDKVLQWMRYASAVLTRGFPDYQFTAVVQADDRFLIGTKHKDWDSWTKDHQWTWVFMFDDWFCASACKAKQYEIVKQISDDMADRLYGKKREFNVEFTPLLDDCCCPSKALSEEILKKVDEDVAKIIMGMKP